MCVPLLLSMLISAVLLSLLLCGSCGCRQRKLARTNCCAEESGELKHTHPLCMYTQLPVCLPVLCCFEKERAAVRREAKILVRIRPYPTLYPPSRTHPDIYSHSVCS